MEDRDGHPEQVPVDQRIRPEKGLESGEAHDDGLYQSQVSVGLESFDQDAEELLDLRVCDILADAAIHDDGSRLESWIVLAEKDEDWSPIN